MLLSAENLYLKKGYNKKYIVKDVSVFLKQGEIVGLLGPNGAGKTSTFNMVVGLERCSSGKIFLDDKEITRFHLWERAKIGIGYLPQESSIFRNISVEDNILLPLQLMNLSKNEIKEKLEYLLDVFDLKKIRNLSGDKLSGGQRRRTEIARLLTINPKFILLDEPYAGVDPNAIKYIHKLLKKLKNMNIGILITDHNIDETLSITDRAYILNEGTIIMDGPTDKIIKDEQVQKVYLGEGFVLKDYT